MNRIITFLTILFVFTQLAVSDNMEASFYLSQEGAIGNWLMLGPLTDPSGTEPLQGHDYDFLNGEEDISPEKEERIEIDGEKYQWKIFSNENTVMVLHRQIGTLENVTVYFFCLLEVAQSGDYVFHVGSDDSVKIWLDGEKIHDIKEVRGIGETRDHVSAAMSKGQHRLLVKVDQHTGGWGLAFQVKDAQGNVPQDMKIVLPGEYSHEEYADLLLEVTPLPLVSKNGKRQFRFHFSRMAKPSDISSIIIAQEKGSEEPLASISKAEKNSFELSIPRSENPQHLITRIAVKNNIIEKRITVKPCRNWRVYLMPGSHVDIGYTNIQTTVLADHKKFIKQAIDLYEESLQKGYMPEARYIWNTEVTWAVKHFLNEEPPADCERLLSYMRQGVVTLDALYLNMLTALCGDEELIRNVYYSAHLAEQEHLPPPIDAMITDVPGYTWGMVPVLDGAGIKYFQLGPNFSARIGYATLALNGQPYYWIGPDGESKVLVWNTGYGYAMIFNLLQSENDKYRLLDALMKFEENENYPYDVAQFRAYFADNTPPPAHLSEVVQEWNQQYQVPKLIISDAVAPFEDLVENFDDVIPSYRGDYTPYWEDGAASSARETAMNRMATLKIQTAETAWAFSKLAGSNEQYPTKDIEIAYDHALLYDEHTWGAHNSITQPESPFAKEQWRIKKGYMEKASWMASSLERQGLEELTEQIQNDRTYAYAVWNLTQWERSDQAFLPTHLSNELDVSQHWIAVDEEGNRSPLTPISGGYSFSVKDIPPFGYKVYELVPESPKEQESDFSVDIPRGYIANRFWEVQLDEKLGAVSSLIYLPQKRQLVDMDGQYGINQYLHVLGPNGHDSKTASAAYLSSGQTDNHLTTSINARIEAQGVNQLDQKVQIYNDIDRVDFINIMDKEDIRKKEAVRFAFPFNVPDGEFTLEIPLAVMHPETNQIPGANRNFYTVRRWIDVSNKEYGVTLVTHDAPLIELCDMHAEQSWLKKLPLVNNHIYSYAMNNYWFTNYKASQGGPVTFRYSLSYHEGPHKPSVATRFADEVSYPLQVLPLTLNTDKEMVLPPNEFTFLTNDASNVLVQNFKQAENGDGFILRLRELDGINTDAKIHFNISNNIKWQLNNIVERTIDSKVHQTDSGVMEVSIIGRGIQTYRVWLN